MALNRPGPGNPFSIGLLGGAATATCSWQQRQAYFQRTCSSTFSTAGTNSSCSLRSQPIRCRCSPHSGQHFSSSERSCSTVSRGRWSGSACPITRSSRGRSTQRFSALPLKCDRPNRPGSVPASASLPAFWPIAASLSEITVLDRDSRDPGHFEFDGVARPIETSQGAPKKSPIETDSNP